MQVLIVDDEKYILEELSEALEDEGYIVLQANTVDTALTILRNNYKINLIITDLKMPGKSGFELIKSAMAHSPGKYKYIIMSGHDSFSEELNSNEFKKIKFLLKPVDIEEILDIVETLTK
ncbi:MAG: response regulator [Gammaproteobacteria bacterium]|nr:response regulator [Gammaproteobacteria bacterium]